MNEHQPIWRQAVKDSSHPLHQATWLLFSQTMTAKGAAKMLAPQQEQIIEYLFQILDTPELQLETSFGAGSAPVNAVELLGEWRVVEAIPRMLDILSEDDWESSLHDRTIMALQNMGTAVIEPLKVFAAENPTLEVTAASILGKVGKGDGQVFEWLTHVFKKQKEEIDVTYLAEILLSNNTPRAIEFLEDQLNRNKYSKGAFHQIQGYLKDAREGKWTY